MAKDPLLLADLEVDTIVKYFQETYKTWQVEEAKAAMDERRPKKAEGASAAKVSKAEVKKLGLDDLGL